MKRDLDLMRQILFYIEENQDIRKGYIKEVLIKDNDGNNIDNYVIREHILLLEDAKLLRKHDRLKVTAFGAGNLTNSGHDYLEIMKHGKRLKRKFQKKTFHKRLKHMGRLQHQ